MNPPPDPEDEKKSHAGSWLMAVMVCLLLYVLSIGPAAALIEKMKIGSVEVFVWFYKPLILLHDHTALRKPIERYVELWVK